MTKMISSVEVIVRKTKKAIWLNHLVLHQRTFHHRKRKKKETQMIVMERIQALFQITLHPNRHQVRTQIIRKMGSTNLCSWCGPSVVAILGILHWLSTQQSRRDTFTMAFHYQHLQEMLLNCERIKLNQFIWCYFSMLNEHGNGCHQINWKNWALMIDLISPN